MDHIQLYWNCGKEGSGQTSSLFLSMFSSLGLYHSPCTMIFHSLGEEFPCIEGTLMHTILSYSLPCFLSKGVMGRRIRKAMVVWPFIKRLSSFILVYVTLFYHFLIFKPTITVLPLRYSDLRDSQLCKV